MNRSIRDAMPSTTVLIHEGDSIMKGSVMRLVVMCCLCEKAYDDMEQEIGKARWKERDWFMAKYQLTRSNVRISHDYCPDCLESYRAFLALAQQHGGASQKEG